ncbi:MAG: hypothetical protein ACFFE4_12530 [Candidatus Thorarchaeota archaeon]
MGKGGVILGILGILLGAGGIGFGVLNWMNQPVGMVEPQWYSYSNDIFTPTPAAVYLPIPNISIVFELGKPMSLHLLFTCSARCLGDAASFSDFIFYFMINGIRQTDMPWARVGSYQSNTNYEYYTVSLQHYIDAMPPDVYNITVVVLSERVGNFVRESSLWIRSSIS